MRTCTLRIFSRPFTSGTPTTTRRSKRPGRSSAGAALREPDERSPGAPGTLESHYAPRATLRLMSAAEVKSALQVLPASIQGLAVYSRSAPRRHPLVQVMPDDPRAVARELFAVLRAFDARGVKLIWVEQPPDTPEWEGVNDRLQRAAAH
ncbi:MAG: hypothetical protein F9K36_18790 [Burkholderiaceae bacterium]|nr:MAG: hypothetical protein F9K36_18790 [Burkholderiaceae bacterium]